MRHGRAALIVTALALLGGAGCATMNKQEQEVMQGQLARIDDRVAVMSKSARAQAELTADFGALRQSILTMTGQIEEFNVRSQLLSDRLTRMEKALAEMGQTYRGEVLERSAATDLRLDTLSRQLYELSLQTLAFVDLMEKKNDITPKTHQRKVDAMRAESGQTQPPPAGDEAESLYQQSYQQFLVGDYDGAVEGFTRLVKKFPDAPLAENAAWWIGESRYAQKQHHPAVAAYDALVKAHPQSPKAPAALLRGATALLAVGETDPAVARLRALIATYPGAEEARIARQTLTSLGLDKTGAPTPQPTPEPMLTPVPEFSDHAPAPESADTPPSGR
ncbi:MAG: tol-pal system protein YbgF [Nitrospinae bacterium]|nr:tol-pal system protein YbgF [Nitrospinota bacterium]